MHGYQQTGRIAAQISAQRPMWQSQTPCTNEVYHYAAQDNSLLLGIHAPPLVAPREGCITRRSNFSGFLEANVTLAKLFQCMKEEVDSLGRQNPVGIHGAGMKPILPLLAQ